MRPGPEGLYPAAPAKTTVKLDFDHRPLPDIPLPNDLATRYDPTSATGLRLNVSMITPTAHERRLRERVDELDGWGLFEHITIPFTGPLDLASIVAAHRDPDYFPDDDVVYLIDVDPDSAHFGDLVPVDVGEGNYPVVLEKRDYWKNDPRGETLSLLYEEVDEDTNGNGVLDPGGDANGDGVLGDGEWPEDTDGDGVLDKPNYLPGAHPAWDDLAGRADALTSFYERETNTLIVRPLVPLHERTTYAVVVTRRLLDADGQPVGSPYPWVNHTAQNQALAALPSVLPAGLSMSDVAFTFAFTTQTAESAWVAVREGLYGHGVQAHLGTEYPAKLEALKVLRDPSDDHWAGVTNPYILPMEKLLMILSPVASELLGMDTSSKQYKLLEDGLGYLDYIVDGSYRSPQLFPREDADGNPLPYNEQVWPVDLDRVPAPARPESVSFTLYVPRKEVSNRGRGEPVPLIIQGHGYSSSRFEALNWAGYFARHGVATIAIDCPSHGIGISDADMAQARGLVGLVGLGGFLDAVMTGRATDDNGDGVPDSGADFWTSYLFHTRDMVRQCGLDYMQLVRILRTFDGTRRWDFDVNGDGQPDLAGDFDGDGVVDVGARMPLGMTGSSLGGIMASMMAGLEPELDAAVPICGGGGLTDIGNRSLQGGVREAVQLRMMAPLYVGTLDMTSDTGGTGAGAMRFETIIPDLNGAKTLPLGTVSGVQAGDTVVVTNEDNHEQRCVTVSPGGIFRLGVPSDRGDRTTIALYRGPQLMGRAECDLADGAAPYATLDAFGQEISFQGEDFAEGAPLVALADGPAYRRASPEFRRIMSLAQLAVDPGDPETYARHFGAEPLHYPATGEWTGTHTIVTTTMGDMNVPAGAGVSEGRAAGFIELRADDPRYGEPVNQVLIDHYVPEAVSVLKRYVDNQGVGVHIDVEDFAHGDDVWTPRGIPRLDPPLRLIGPDAVCRAAGSDATSGVAGGPNDPVECGISGSLFPMSHPEGKHDLPVPGDNTDRAIAQCEASCTDDCGACGDTKVFDMGLYFFNLIARYVVSDGTSFDLNAMCNATNTCEDVPPRPAPRPDDAQP